MVGEPVRSFQFASENQCQGCAVGKTVTVYTQGPEHAHIKKAGVAAYACDPRTGGGNELGGSGLSERPHLKK